MTTTTETFLCRVDYGVCYKRSLKTGKESYEKLGQRFLDRHNLHQGDEFRLEQVVTVTKLKPASAEAKAGDDDQWKPY